MGYFSNSTQGGIFEAQNCAKCAHNSEDKGCPVMDAHLLYNYDQYRQHLKELKTVLSLLIPVDDQGFNKECAMFLDASKLKGED